MQKTKQLSLLLLTVSASGISFLTSLTIAKIYQTTEFGEFSYYFAIATILSGLLSLRIDTTSLVHPELNGTDRKFITTITTIALPILIVFADSNTILTFTLAASMAAFTSSTYSLILRNKQTLIGAFKLALAVSILIAQISINAIQLDLNNLLLGATLANIAVSLLFMFASKDRSICKNATFAEEIKKIIQRRTPISKNFVAWLIETSISFTPIIIISAKFNPHSAGLFAFSEKLFRAPTAIIISSVIPFAINRIIKSPSTLPIIKKYWLGSLILTSPILLTPFISAPLISHVWGPEWIEAAQICSILYPLFFLQTVISSTNFVFNKTNKLTLYSTLQSLHLSAIFFALTLPDSLIASLKLYTATSITFYLLIAILQIKLGRDNDKVNLSQSILQDKYS